MANVIKLVRDGKTIGTLDLVGLTKNSLQRGVKFNIRGKDLRRKVRLAVVKNDFRVSIIGGHVVDDLRNYFDGTMSALEALGEQEGFTVETDLDMDPYEDIDQTDGTIY